MHNPIHVHAATRHTGNMHILCATTLFPMHEIYMIFVAVSELQRQHKNSKVYTATDT